MINYSQFFQDDNGASSMTRLLLFGSFLITSIVMLAITYMDKMSEGYLTIFMGTFAGTYGYGKHQDNKITLASMPPQPPTPNTP